MTRPLSVLGLSGLLATAGCAKASATVHPPGVAPVGDVTIQAKDYKFAPTELRLLVGRDVTIVVENWDKKTAHNIRFPTLPGSPKSPLVVGPSYLTLTVRFDKAGVYPFQCDPHIATMTGHVTAS